MRTIAAGLALLILIACGDDPTGVAAVAELEIVTSADTVQFGDSIRFRVSARDEKGNIIEHPPVVWRSSTIDIATVDERGVVRALRPGVALIAARVGAQSDSVRIRVVTSACAPLQIIREHQNGYWGTYIQPGFTRYAEAPSGITEYRGTPLFWGSGIIYGTSPDTTLVGFDYFGMIQDFRTGVCRATGPPMHTVSLLRLESRAGNPLQQDVADLIVVQDQWAFTDPVNDDYVLFRYSFTNSGGKPIENLRIGIASDYDVYGAATNVAKYEAATGVASVTSSDSLTQPVTGGVVLLGPKVAAYRTPAAGTPRPSRSDHFNLLEPGRFDTSPSSVYDVKQILGAAPITLAPGETHVVGYALVAGESRAAFEENVRAARIKAATLW